MLGTEVNIDSRYGLHQPLDILLETVHGHLAHSVPVSAVDCVRVRTVVDEKLQHCRTLGGGGGI